MRWGLQNRNVCEKAMKHTIKKLKLHALEITAKNFEELTEEEKDWLRYVYKLRIEGGLNEYIQEVQREFVTIAPRQGNVTNMRRVIDVAEYVRWIAARVTPDGRLTAIPIDEINKMFGKNS